MIIRDAATDDVEACNLVWASTQRDIGSAPVPAQPLALHELATGRAILAEVDGSVVGFGATLTRSGVAYLADLFVVPAHQSSGVGRTLLQALFAGHRGQRFTFASTDPRARWLYERFGMHVVEPYHYIDACLDAIVPPPSDVELIPGQPPEIAVVDSAVTRRDRTVDIAHANSLGATWYLARRGGENVGVVAVIAPTWWSPWHPHGCRIGPVMAHDPDDIAPILAATLSTIVTVQADAGTDVVSTYVPSSLPALPALLGAGFEVLDTDLLMASDDALIDRHRYLPSVDTP